MNQATRPALPSFSFFTFLRHRVSCSIGKPQTCYVVKAHLELLVLLAQPPERWWLKVCTTLSSPDLPSAGTRSGTLTRFPWALLSLSLCLCLSLCFSVSLSLSLSLSGCIHACMCPDICVKVRRQLMTANSLHSVGAVDWKQACCKYLYFLDHLSDL